MESLSKQASKRLLTTQLLCLIKNVYKLIKLIQDQVKTIDTGSIVCRWGVIPMNLHDSRVTEITQNSSDIMKPYLLNHVTLAVCYTLPNKGSTMLVCQVNYFLIVDIINVVNYLESNTTYCTYLTKLATS